MQPSKPISTLPPAGRPPRAAGPAPSVQAAGPGLAGRSVAEQAAQLGRLPAAGRPGALLAVQRTLGNRHAQKVVQRKGFPPAKESTSGDLLKALEAAATRAADGTVSRTAVFRALVAAPYAARQDPVVSLFLDSIFPQNSTERLALSALQAYGPAAYWPLEVSTRLMKEDAPLFHQVAGLAQEWKIDESPHVVEERQKAGLQGVLKGEEPPAAPPPIKAFFVPGRTAEVALVLGGVHGDEPSGVEVAEKLIEKLKSLPSPPHFTVVVVPRLFAANVEAGLRETPADKNPYRSEVNRNLPTLRTGTDAAAKKKTYLGTTGFPLDSRGRPIQPENLALLELIRKFNPVRIASVHAHPEVKSAGVFAEVHKTAPGASESETDKADAHTEKDKELALEMARKISKKFPQLTLGNRLGTGNSGGTAVFPAGPSERGVSFGEYMREPVQSPSGKGREDRPSITTLTIEVAGTARSGESTDPKRAAQRAAQLEAYADALLEVFLNKAP